MKLPLQITFRGMDSSEAIESLLREQAGRLERFHDHITHCHVVVDLPHRHHRKGRQFELRIDITTPTGDIAATRSPAQDRSHEDFRAVVRDAFDAVVRQLQTDAQQRRGRAQAREAKHGDEDVLPGGEGGAP